MKYMRKNKEFKSVAEEIIWEEARLLLEGYWVAESLDDIFENDRLFRLYTPDIDVWTVSDNGMVPMPGFYGVVG